MNQRQGASADTREPFFDAETATNVMPVPEGLVSGPAALRLCGDGAGFALAGGPLAFTHARLGGDILSAAQLRQAAGDALAEDDSALADTLERLSAPRADFAGLALSGAGARPRIMGVCNVTPDSFSDGGDHADPDAAVAFARALVAAGADIVDVGGESTRPGADPVSVDAECARVLPVISALAKEGVLVSIDTRKTSVMQAAVEAGARIVNDVGALADDGAVEAVARSDASVILMHMHGTPENMQDDPRYVDVVGDVYGMLAGRVAMCRAAGIPSARIALDPGFGFGKTVAHNETLLRDLAVFHGLGCALAVGLSRKSFIGVWTGETDPKARVTGSVAAALAAVARGTQIVRVHDVDETRRALDVWRHASGWAV
jgi:dihydropteroate synthase